MKKRCLFLLFSLCALSLSAAEWLTDFSQAQIQARAEKKLVLLNFTGSDWCGWCMKLKRDVFSTTEFSLYAKTNLVLVELDFPRQKRLPPKRVEANQALAAKYRVTGYPTIIVLNSSGYQIGKLGYMRGGPKAFNEALEKLKKK